MPGIDRRSFVQLVAVATTSLPGVVHRDAETAAAEHYLGIPDGKFDVIFHNASDKGITVRWSMEDSTKFNCQLQGDGYIERATFLMKNLTAKKKMDVTYTPGAPNWATDIFIWATPVF